MRIISVIRLGFAGSIVGSFACGSGSANGGFSLGQDGGALRDGSMAITTGDSGLLSTGDTGSTMHTSGDSGLACPPGLQCDISCSGGGNTTSITGRVYDPALRNPLYNIAVYVPAVPLTPLPRGVATGNDSCSCGSLFQSGAITNTTTTTDGTFRLNNVPVGSDVPLVIQIGKWRRQYKLNIKACEDNAQPDKSLAFLSTVPASDTIDNMPDIAVSTGALDTLECLLIRVGIASSEYVPGAAAGGHVHIFSGGNDGSSPGGTGGGSAESPPMTGAPTSWTALWDQQAHMMPYDVVLLSCEGDETYNSNPPVLEQYLNAGGRAFGSHYHYAWFAGTLSGENVPAPPNDWGTSLADWGAMLSTQTTGAAEVVQTLTGTNTPFPKGVAMKQWLGVVGGLGVEGAPAGEIPIFDENQDVGATHKAQAWLTDQGWTDYLSFNTPVNAPNSPDGGPPNYCGRAVFADLHVSSDNTYTMDSNPPPSGCQDGELSPQEKALEFMLFDLSSCVVPDTVAVPQDAGLPPPPK